jgi:hypothetical protein
MRFLSALLLALVVASTASATDMIVSGPRRTVVVSGAEGHATVIARRGALVHSSCGQVEGIGFSTVSPDHAIRSCCFWGRRQAVDIGVSWSPIRRGWFAVVRYR